MISVPSRGWRRALNQPALNALAAPHGLSRYLEALNPLWSLDSIRARVLRVTAETADTVSLELAVNGNWPGCKAGQYVQLAVEIDGVVQRRCYSISNAEFAARPRLTIKAQADGTVSRHVNQQLRPGDIVSLSRPMGDFVLPERIDAPLLFIAGGSGITPVMSMLDTLFAQGHQGPICLFYYANSAADLIFGAQLSTWQQRQPGFQLMRCLRQGAGGELQGLFEPEHLELAGFDFASAHSYVCGPAPLMDAVHAVYEQLGLAQRLRSERFVSAAPAASGTAGGEIRLRRSERILANDGGNLLEQAEAAGLRPESGCRMGICHSCSCTKLSGRVRDLVTGQLSGDGEESIRLCISAPQGDVTLEL